MLSLVSCADTHIKGDANDLEPLQTRSVDMPSDSTFAVAMRTQQEAERAEQQRIKSLVLNYDLSTTDDQLDGEDPHLPHAPDFAFARDDRTQRIRLIGTGSLNPSLPNQSRRSSRTRGGHQGRLVQPLTSHHKGRVDSGTSETVNESSRPLQMRSSTANGSFDHGVPSSIHHESAPLADTTNAQGTHAQVPLDGLHHASNPAAGRFDKSGNTRSKQRARRLQLGDIDW